MLIDGVCGGSHGFGWGWCIVLSVLRWLRGAARPVRRGHPESHAHSRSSDTAPIQLRYSSDTAQTSHSITARVLTKTDAGCERWASGKER